MRIPPLATLSLVLLLPSCISTTLTTAAVAGSGLSQLPGVSALLGRDAPQAGELCGRSFDYSGEQRDAGNVTSASTGSILFGSSNPAVLRLADGSTRSVFYSRQDRKRAIITITTPAGVESYRLLFSDAGTGTYTYEKRQGADFATGEGMFSIR